MSRVHMLTAPLLALSLLAPTVASADDPATGISVRGDWHIEVRNTDGTLASAHDFRNAFVDLPNVIALVLSGSETAGAWSVSLVSSLAANGPCNTSPTGDSPSACHIFEPKPGIPNFLNVSPTLSVAVLMRGLKLSGNATMARDGVIDRVRTLLFSCAPSLAPDACTMGLGGGTLTEHTFPSGQEIPVLSGQQVLVNVTLSFLAAP